MSQVEPTLVRHVSIAALPPVDEIVRLVQTENYRLLEIRARVEMGADGNFYDPASQQRKRFVQELAARLPDHIVSDIGTGFDYGNGSPNAKYATQSITQGDVLVGTARIGIRSVTPKHIIQQSSSLFACAAAQYETLATSLMVRLANQLNMNVSHFSFSESWPAHEQMGSLRRHKSDPGLHWRYFVHGMDCRFTNKKPYFKIEALLGFGAECGNNFGVLHPVYFSDYVESERAFTPLVDMLQGGWSTTARTLEIIEQMGILRRVASPYNRGGQYWFLTDAGRKHANEARAEGGASDA